MSSKPLSGKVAIVTGSGRGIGAAIIQKLASHGAHVVVNYHSSAQRAEQVAHEARENHGVRALCVKADVSRRSDVFALFETTKAEFGRVDIVMSNSGIEHFGTLAETTEEQIDAVFATNVKAQYFVAQACDVHLEKGGRLILISSVSAVWGVKRHSIYAASKAAITGMVKCLAHDFGDRQITVNCIAPGGVKTDMWADYAADYIEGGSTMAKEDVERAVAGMSPLKRAGLVDDIAGVVGLLASEDAQWLTGQTVHVSGGAHMATA